jgi:MCM N-terminal domain
LSRNYVEQMDTMVAADASTLYVDYAQMAENDFELAEAIEVS